jgi:hypothetical protein
LAHEKEPSSSPQKLDSPLGLLGILALSFGAWFLSKLSDPKHKSGGTQHQETNSCPTKTLRNDASSPAHVIIDSTPSQIKERETKEKDANTRDEKRLFWERLTAILLAVYTAVNFGMWCASRDLAKSTARQISDSEASQAAQLVIQDFEIKLKCKPVDCSPENADQITEFSIGLSYRLKNVGPTVATSISSSGGNGGIRELNQSGRGCLGIQPGDDVEGSWSIANGETITFVQDRAGGIARPQEIQAILKNENPKQGFIVAVEYGWRDIFKNPHHTGICMYYRPNGTFSRCVAGCQ